MRFLAPLIALVAASAAVASVTHARHPGGDGRDIELIASVKKGFGIKGVPVTGLYPGATRPLRVKITNTYAFAIRVATPTGKAAAKTTRPAVPVPPRTSASSRRARAAWSSPRTSRRPSSFRSRCRRPSPTRVRERRSSSRSGPKPHARNRPPGAGRSLTGSARRYSTWTTTHGRHRARRPVRRATPPRRAVARAGRGMRGGGALGGPSHVLAAAHPGRDGVAVQPDRCSVTVRRSAPISSRSAFSNTQTSA